MLNANEPVLNAQWTARLLLYGKILPMHSMVNEQFHICETLNFGYKADL